MAGFSAGVQLCFRFALVLLSFLDQFGHCQDSCAPGPGFVESLLVPLHRFLYNGNVIVPRFSFPCSGTIVSMNMTMHFRPDFYYNSPLEMDMTMWKVSGSQFVQTGKFDRTVQFIRPGNLGNSVAGTQFYNFTVGVNRQTAVVKSSSPVNVTAGTILGILLPVSGMYNGQPLVNGIPFAVQDDVSERYPIVEERDECWNPSGSTTCNSLVVYGRPLFVVEFVPDSTSLSPTPTSSSVVPTSSPSTPVPTACTVEGTNFYSLVALAVVFAVTLLVLIVVAVVGVVLLLRRKLLKSGGYRVQYATNPVAVTEQEAYVTMNGDARDSVHEPALNGRPKMGLPPPPNCYQEHETYNHFPRATEWCPPVRCDTGAKYATVAALYGNIDQKPQYVNSSSHMTVPSMEDRRNISAMDSATVIYSALDGEESGKELYWPPAKTKEDIYDQMSKKKYQEIPRNSIDMRDLLGEGEFGQVFHGEWLSPFGPVEVAVKVSNNADSKERVKLLQEAAVMGQFLHIKVVRLYGVVTFDEPNMVIIEYLKNGDLLKYIQGINLPAPADLPEKLLRFCTEICDGLNYLSKKGFIHRDLAARNILLDKDYHCKIADFGMSRHLEEGSYYIIKGGRIPLKWTAPEVILYRKYSTKSDVWSYGMVMYEIWSLGHEPYEDYSTDEIMNILGTGFCLYPPPGCPRGIYSLMAKCWNPDYHKRVDLDHVLAELQVDQETLLSWREEDRSVSPQADVLGAPLEEGENLYRDLQMSYKN